MAKDRFWKTMSKGGENALAKASEALLSPVAT